MKKIESDTSYLLTSFGNKTPWASCMNFTSFVSSTHWVANITWFAWVVWDALKSSDAVLWSWIAVVTSCHCWHWAGWKSKTKHRNFQNMAHSPLAYHWVMCQAQLASNGWVINALAKHQRDWHCWQSNLPETQSVDWGIQIYTNSQIWTQTMIISPAQDLTKNMKI